MIGFTYGQQADKLLDIERRTIISSRHVTFDETGTILEAESAPWHDLAVEGQWEGLLPEHLHQLEHYHDDDDDKCPPNPKPVRDEGIVEVNIPD